MLLGVHCAWGHDVEVDGIFYNLNQADKTASVTFQGPRFTYNEDEYVDDVVIPQSLTVEGVTYAVTSVGERCFSRCKSLNSVVLPNSVTSVGEYCFAGCDSLLSVTLPNALTALAPYSFANCPQLASITLPESVTSLGDYCFTMCSSLTSIVIPNYYCPLNPKTTPLTFRKTEVWLSAYHGQAPFVKK